MTTSPSSRGPAALPSSSIPNDSTSVGWSAPRCSRLSSRIRSSSTNSTAMWPSSMSAEESARMHSSRTSSAVGPSRSSSSIPSTSTSRSGTPFRRTELRSQPFGVLVVGRDDPPHELVTDDVLVAEVDEGDALDAVEDLVHDEQARLLVGRQVDLRHVSGDDHLRVEPEPGQKHLHLLGGRVLRLVEDDEAVVERTAAHERQRRDLDHAALKMLRDLLGL